MDYFTADLHLGHVNIIKYCNRPFKTITEMDDHLINSINEYVKKEDSLWLLGDFCFGPLDVNLFLRKATGYRDRINCENIIFIWGNHDPNMYDERDKANRFRHLFSSDHHLLNVNIGHKRMTLCHYPMVMFSRSNKGGIQLYGHSHGKIEKWMDEVLPNRKSMDVGIDNAYNMYGIYKPFSFYDVMNHLNSKSGFTFEFERKPE